MVWYTVLAVVVQCCIVRAVICYLSLYLSLFLRLSPPPPHTHSYDLKANVRTGGEKSRLLVMSWDELGLPIHIVQTVIRKENRERDEYFTSKRRARTCKRAHAHRESVHAIDRYTPIGIKRHNKQLQACLTFGDQCLFCESFLSACLDAQRMASCVRCCSL